MKKIYMAPLTEVVKINAEQMICDSNVAQKTMEITNENVGEFVKADKDDFDDFDESLW